MQLRFVLPLTKITGSGFKHSTSALLSAITLGGVFSTLIFNSDTASSKLNESFKAISKVLIGNQLYSGVKEVGNTLKGWGEAIVTSKDDFKDWLYRYLGPDGFKSGVANLYEKLNDWALIIYTWFKDKFIEFIKNIPDMVENWKKLRFTLFKWGTFLGGGGGSALWAMFGSFANLGKLADLMGNDAFKEAAEKFAELVDENPEAFQNMNQEEMQEILERIAEEPETAKEIIEELQQEQKEMSEKSKAEGKEKKELEKERIQEAFGKAKGKPQKQDQVFGYLAGKVLQDLLDLSKSSSFFGEVKPEPKAKAAIKKYIQEIENEKSKETKAGKAYKEFLESLGGDKQTLIDEFSKLATKAFWKAKEKGEEEKIESLKKELEEVIKNDLTTEIQDGEDDSSKVEIENLIQLPTKK